MKNRGFSLIEVVLVFALLAVCLMALAMSNVSNMQATESLKENDVVMAQAETIVSRLDTLAFGSPHANYPTSDQLDRLFSGRPFKPTEVPTLSQVGYLSPLRFRLAGTEATGEWVIYIDNDLDGDGYIDEEEPSREGRDDLLRIDIRYEGKRVLKTMRAIRPQEIPGG